MTEDERELLMLVSSVVVGITRDSYGENLQSCTESPVLAGPLKEINDKLMDYMTTILALQARIKDPAVSSVDLATLKKHLEGGIIESIKDEMMKIEGYDDALRAEVKAEIDAMFRKGRKR